MQSNLYIIKNGLLRKQTDILECSRNTCFVNLNRFPSN